MTSPDLGTRHLGTHESPAAGGATGIGAGRGALHGLVPIWCGVVLLAVATTLFRMPGVVLAVAWVGAWVASSAGLGLIAFADEPGGRASRVPARLARR